MCFQTHLKCQTIIEELFFFSILFQKTYKFNRDEIVRNCVLNLTWNKELLFSSFFHFFSILLQKSYKSNKDEIVRNCVLNLTWNMELLLRSFFHFFSILFQKSSNCFLLSPWSISCSINLFIFGSFTQKRKSRNGKMHWKMVKWIVGKMVKW